jgi:anthranilate phosphoribosyltransferase
VITPKGERIFSAVELGKRTVLPQDIEGGATVKDAAQIFLKVLKCEGSWSQTAVVLANAAMALQCSGRFADHQSAYEAAVESLESGRAWNCFEKLISLQ